MSKLNKDTLYPIIFGGGIGSILAFMLWLAVAPYEQVAWFYGYPHKVVKETRYMEIKTMNGKTDTIYTVREDSVTVYKNYKQVKEN